MTEFTRRGILTLIGSMSTISFPTFLDSDEFKIQSIDYPGGTDGAKLQIIEGAEVTEDRIDRDVWKQFIHSTLSRSGHYLPDLDGYRLFRFYYTNSTDFHLGYKSGPVMVNIYRVNSENFDYYTNIHDFDSDLEMEVKDDEYNQMIQEIKSHL